MKRSAKPNLLPFETSEADVQKCAYFLWQQEGRPTGRDLKIWLTAEKFIRHHVPDHRFRPTPLRRRSA